MEITINLSRLEEWFGASPLELMWAVFVYGGWVVLSIALLWGLFYLRLYFQRKKWLLKQKQILLAIDIPKDNEQSMIAVEQMFASLHGIKKNPNTYEKYWEGQTQLNFSLEIVSFEGYIQFLVRTPDFYRELVESAIYSQYPEAEVTEVEDYVGLIPTDVHQVKSDFNIWATEFNLNRPTAYPIKTYKMFEHTLPGVFIDPMASLLEVMSKIGPGEQIGLQLIVVPVGDSWKEGGYSMVKTLIGDKTPPKKTFSDKLVEGAAKSITAASESVYKLWGDIKEKKEEKMAEKNNYMSLTTNQKAVVEAIENKLAKLSFACTFRMYYLAHKDVFKFGRGVNTVFGAINQFGASDLNSFSKYKNLTTSVDYFFVKTRVTYIKKKFLKYYKARSRKGSPEFMLGTEELATIYHFPTINVKAPLLQKTAAKKGEPPSLLPLAEIPGRQFFVSEPMVEGKQSKGDIAAEKREGKNNEEKETYKITESLEGYDFDNDYFEERFAKRDAQGNIQAKAVKPQDLSNIKKEISDSPAIPTSGKSGNPPSNLPFVN